MKRKIIILGICMTLVLPVLGAVVSANSPPSTPEINGKTSGKTGTSYEYSFCSTDPDGDDIYYCVDWGDGSGEVCLGPFPSGTCIYEKHTWTSDGSYRICAKARDIHEAESSETCLSVSMPRVRLVHLFFQVFLEKIFDQFPILRALLI